MTSIMRALLYDSTAIKISGKMLASTKITNIRIRSFRRNATLGCGQSASREKIGPNFLALGFGGEKDDGTGNDPGDDDTDKNS